MLLSQKIQKLPALSGKQMNRRRLWRHLKNRPNCLDGLVADFRTTDFPALTMHRGEQILFLCPRRRASPVIADLTVQIGQFLLQRFAQSGDPFLQTFAGDAACALAFRHDHLDDLAPSGDKIGEHLCCLVRQLANLRFGLPRRNARSLRRRSDRSWPVCRARGQKPAPAPD